MQQPAAQHVLIVATDGQLSDFPEAFAALRAYPGTVLILALGGALPAEWAEARPHLVISLDSAVRFGVIAHSITDELRRLSHERDNQVSRHG